MMPPPDTRRQGALRHEEALWRADPMPDPVDAPAATRPPLAWLGSGWFIGPMLVVALALVWAAAQGWLP